MVSGNGHHTQEEEDEGLSDGGQHLHNMPDGGAGSLRHVLLHVVLHGDGTCYDAAGRANHTSVRLSYRKMAKL